ncbi:hypothetical protein SDC9_17718 [bioreactor metagenome]|uniref:Uncharacterized protein n=1 Tax=bioreactor metagenome TaxID=1076179 RepID=A0A644TZ60_9ZZZZ|nr:hypothetical protein [Lentimicrobium sp.]MEA5111644.1 hypothetical protein [Lentimicrobium sp.]
MNAGTSLRKSGLTLADLPKHLYDAYNNLVNIVNTYNKIPDGRKKRLYRDLILKADDAIMKQIKVFSADNSEHQQPGRIIRFEAKYFKVNSIN